MAEGGATSTESFSESEKQIIMPYFTNLDKNIFVLKNLPEVIMGTLFSRYSRSDKSVRRLLLDEFISNKDIFAFDGTQAGSTSVLAQEKAEQFYERVLVGYGDDSVAELAGTHIACEEVSSLVGDYLTDSRIGISPLEKSARYVLFDKKVNGRYRWYREPKIMESRYGTEYEQLMDKIFDLYSKWVPMTMSYVKEVTPRDPAATDRAFDSACRAKACDLLKNMFTPSRLTNVGLFGNGRAFEYLITKLYSSGLSEAVSVGKSIHEELSKVLPSFVKRAQESEYIVSRRADMEAFARAQALPVTANTDSYVKLVDYDKGGEDNVLTAMLYPHSQASMQELKEFVKRMPGEKRHALVAAYLARRKNRRDKAGRALESLYYTFEVCSNYGMFRDLHRHRVLSMERQVLTATLGYDLPKELAQVGLDKEYRQLMEEAKSLYAKVAREMPLEAQYVVPRSFHLRYYMKLNLREMHHLTELRSQKQGHPDYRKIAQQMKMEISKTHPDLTGYMFVDMNEYALARLESEKKIDEKMAKLNEKERKMKGQEKPK
jgi:thymidylate synthase ThyX